VATNMDPAEINRKGAKRMALDRKKIIVLYYIDELTIKKISEIMGVKSAETIRYQLFFKEPQMQKRNREWTDKDDFELALHFSKLATGVNFEKDMEKIALTMQRGKSIIKKKALPMWEEAYSRVIASEELQKIVENVTELKSDVNELKKNEPQKQEIVQLKIYQKEIFMSNGRVSIKFKKQEIGEEERAKYVNEGSHTINLYAEHAAHIAANGGVATIGTGMSVAIPDGYFGLILPNQQLVFDNSATILNSPTIIQGKSNEEIKIILINHSHGAMVRTLNIEPGHKVAELLILPIINTEII